MDVKKSDIVRDPAAIERRSMEIIGDELAKREIEIAPENLPVVKRAIHASADFDYAENLRFLNDPVAAGIAAVKAGREIVTDTNMAASGVHAASLKLYGSHVSCFMADPDVAALANELGTTRAEVSMEKAARDFDSPVLVIGNAPTALLAVSRLIETEAFVPSLVIGVPVGFVNVEESKEAAFEVCSRMRIPAILAMGRKGGSSVAAAIMNAIIYEAAGRKI